MPQSDWWASFLSAAAGGAAAAGVIAFLARESLTRFFDRKAEQFKHQLGVDATTRELLLRSQIEFKERQLAEFYGPIYAYLKRGRPIYDLWTKGRLDEVEGDIRTLFTTANEEIVRIILTKSHLVRGPSIPESFTLFLTHVAVWHAYLKTTHKGVPLSRQEFPEAYYPDDFAREIVETTESLKREIDDLYGRYGVEVASAAAPLARES
jgi:hypothetical protein